MRHDEKGPRASSKRDCPPRWYSDPAHYERELNAFWYAGWVAVAREEEIAAAGDWRVARIGTQSIIVLRGEDPR